MTDRPIRVGVIGCGSFALFSLEHFTQVPGVSLAGMAGTHRQAAYAAARRYGLGDIVDVDGLLRRDDIDVIYIATPPFLHHPQAMMALQAGKHVICEKPFALTIDQADEMIRTAQQSNLLVVANLMQRYNAYYDIVRRIIDERILGDLLHGYFENYATDEWLGRDHWFWDRSKSGGIFIEHGVHFFDLFEGWIGPGQVVAAQRTIRPDSDIEEQVQCTVRYRDGIHVQFYHGFHQPARMDRQEMRLVFERGDLALYEWIPTRVRIRALADETQTRLLCELFPNARIDSTHLYSGKDRACAGRHKSIDAQHMVELAAGDEDFKMHRYGRMLRAIFHDQLAWIRDRSHVRRVTEENGRRSLTLAVEADRLARAGA